MRGVARWAAAFAVTQAVEIPVYAAWQPGVSWPRRLAVAAIASLITHPFVWMGVLATAGLPYAGRVGVAEVFAVSVEAWWLGRQGVRRPWVASLTANAASVAAGAALRAAWDWP